MCGIAGEVSYTVNLKNRENEFLKMQKVLSPRGPDQKGEYITEKAALVHRRLSVIDLENGKQPMTAQDDENRYCIVYNGELYNTEEIRNELKRCGFVFTTHSDTEVILKAFIKWKEKCVDKFNGIFAFAVWDEKNERLFAARDRIGVKPFFYSLKNGNFIFGSEFKAILANSEIQPIIDLNSIAEIMFIGPGRTSGNGVFKDISELKPGSFLYFDRSGLEIKKYWSLKDKEFTDSFDQAVEKTRFLVTDSIKRQLVADVPVCTFLSGGLDSSIISSVAARYFAEKGVRLKTLSVDYKDNAKYFKASKFQPNSDPEYIKIMSEYLGSEHKTVLIDTGELVDALYSAVDARDLPGMADVDASLLLFCKSIKENGTVALSGECADEIFGGYPWYRDPDIREKYGFPWAQTADYRESFLLPEIAEAVNGKEYADKAYRSTLNDTDKISGISPLESRMKEMMRLNFDWFMQTLLDRKDRMSMYNGLEVRVPFCDYRIAEYLYTVPWKYKDYNGVEKGLLREAMKDYLPEKVLYRKKSPYPKTHNPAYLEAVSERLRNEVLSDSNAPIFKFVKKTALENLLCDNRAVPWYGQLMNTPQTIAYMLQINYWLKKFNVIFDY